MSDNRDVALIIRLCRRHSGLNITDFAKRLGIGRPTLYRWEKGVNPPALTPELWEYLRDFLMVAADGEVCLGEDSI